MSTSSGSPILLNGVIFIFISHRIVGDALQKSFHHPSRARRSKRRHRYLAAAWNGNTRRKRGKPYVGQALSRIASGRLRTITTTRGRAMTVCLGGISSPSPSAICAGIKGRHDARCVGSRFSGSGEGFTRPPTINTLDSTRNKMPTRERMLGNTHTFSLATDSLGVNAGMKAPNTNLKGKKALRGQPKSPYSSCDSSQSCL